MANLKLFILIAVMTGFVAAFFLFSGPAAVIVNSPEEGTPPAELAGAVNEAAAPSSSAPTSSPAASPKSGDAPNQPRLASVPDKVKGLYVTGWIAGSSSRLAPLVKLVRDTSLNAMVIDVKDYSGYVSYRTGVPGVAESGAEKEPRIIHPNRLIEELHKDGIYLIARITIFQDSILSKSRPDLALKDAAGGLWKDRKGLNWMDPASQEVWDYNIAIAKDALARGFDEVNFDYIRFPSDGDLDAIRYPVWDEKSSREEVIRGFFEYLRREMGDARISADLFGLAAVSFDDLGIGQKIEAAYPHFDSVMPMVYPSHYARGFLGYRNPAEYPYEVVHNSMSLALERRERLRASTTAPLANLRPWLQSFDLGADYDAAKIAAQIKAVDDALGSGEANGGWVLWDPKNTYVHYKE